MHPPKGWLLADLIFHAAVELGPQVLSFNNLHLTGDATCVFAPQGCNRKFAVGVFG